MSFTFVIAGVHCVVQGIVAGGFGETPPTETEAEYVANSIYCL